MRILPSSVHAWLHEGEQGAIEVERNPWILFSLCATVFALCPVAYFGALSAPFLTFTVASLFAGAGIVYWRRTATVLTPTAILFRGLLGKPFEVPLIGIKRVSDVLVSGEGADYVVKRLEFFVGGFLDLPWHLSGGVLIRRAEELVEAVGATTDQRVRHAD